ncbi:MAG: hypothetical protein LUE21_07120 [Oscillospiraceae bacterium]|nr:hypothetical protein [Oscillospiraceae bacterium]
MSNEQIRRAAGGAGLRLWQIAAAMGMSDSSFSRWLRTERSEEEKNQVLEIINSLKEAEK